MIAKSDVASIERSRPSYTQAQPGMIKFQAPRQLLVHRRMTVVHTIYAYSDHT